MTPTNPTPPKASSRQVPTPPKASSRQVPTHHHDDHLYGSADLHNEEVDHEHSDVNIRAILGSAVGLFLVVGACAVIVWGLFYVLEGQAAKNDPVMSPLAMPAGQLPPQPRLLTDEPQNLQLYRDSVAERLKGIEQGKQQFLEQGPPVRANAPVDPWMGTWSASRGESSGGRAIPLRPGALGGTPAALPQTPAQPQVTAPTAPVKKGGH